MHHDWKESIAALERTKAWSEKIDRRKFEPNRPCASFDSLVPLSEIRDKRVLDIGVSGAQCRSRSLRAGVYLHRLTSYAVDSIRRRFELFDLPGSILRMDGEATSVARPVD